MLLFLLLFIFNSIHITILNKLFNLHVICIVPAGCMDGACMLYMLVACMVSNVTVGPPEKRVAIFHPYSSIHENIKNATLSTHKVVGTSTVSHVEHY